MALNSLHCAEVPLRNYSLSHCCSADFRHSLLHSLPSWSTECSTHGSTVTQERWKALSTTVSRISMCRTFPLALPLMLGLSNRSIMARHCVGMIIHVICAVSATGMGTIFRLGEQKLVKNIQDNQIQNITVQYVFFKKGTYSVQSGLGQSPQKMGSFGEFLC